MKDGISISNAETQDSDEQLDLFSNQPLPVLAEVTAGVAGCFAPMVPSPQPATAFKPAGAGRANL